MKRMAYANRRFLSDFYEVLPHHVNCILKSGMVLDEDMSLLSTFWDPTYYRVAPNSRHQLLLTSATFTVGVATTIKLKTIYPLLISMLPATLQLMKGTVVYYRMRQYKKRFEHLVNLIKSIYALNREIAKYYRKRDTAVHDRKLQIGAFNLLEKPGEKFLKLATENLYEIIDQIRNCMVNVCHSVPISDGEFIASIDWNLDSWRINNGFGFKEMLAQFDKLEGLYLLIVSNFLGCVGLSCCIQLWREPCQIRHVFNRLIPELGQVLERLLNEITSNFNSIRFNLCTDIVDKEGGVVKRSRLDQPIMDLLLSLQVAFESVKVLQLIEPQGKSEESIAILDEIRKQLGTSKDMLEILSGRLATVKHTSAPTVPPIEIGPIVIQQTDVNTNDGGSEFELEDEEYNLSIHGSEPEELDCISDEPTGSPLHLHTVLLELKTKLLQHEGKLGKQAREELDRGDFVKSMPIEEPPPRIPVIPTIEGVNGLLQAVKLTAQKLNRSEEVFGSGTVSSNDSDSDES